MKSSIVYRTMQCHGAFKGGFTEKGRSELSLEERTGVYQVDKGRGLASQRDKDKAF